MQVFCPYPEPINVAQCLDPRRLNKQIIECQQILDAIEGIGKGWFNHPVVKMYSQYKEWLEHYKNCLEAYKEGQTCEQNETLGYILYISSENNKANELTPPFLTEEFCIQHRRRLYTKDKEYYKQFAKYGESQENWYFVEGRLIKYINGKRIDDSKED